MIITLTAIAVPLLGWEHINLTGYYIWSQINRVEKDKFRPLRASREP
jgi:hypothetical protein